MPQKDCLFLSDIYSRPAPSDAVFVSIIVKLPVIQSLTILLAFFIIALEFPLHQLKSLVIHRSIILRIVLLLFQAFLTILFYQVRLTRHLARLSSTLSSLP